MNRFRRMRANNQLRNLVRETHLNKSDFIYPLFVVEGKNKKNPVESMPGVFQYSIDRIDEILKEIDSSGISGLLIFGIPEHKDEQASRSEEHTSELQSR